MPGVNACDQQGSKGEVREEDYNYFRGVRERSGALREETGMQVHAPASGVAQQAEFRSPEGDLDEGDGDEDDDGSSQCTEVSLVLLHQEAGSGSDAGSG